MSDQPTITTAGALNDFRHELLAGGYAPDDIGGLACIALKTIVEDGGLVVREVAAQ